MIDQHTTVDGTALDDAVEWCNGRLRMHGGGIEVVSVDDASATVTVRFTGMCTACAWKTLTWLGTVRDAIAAVPGVRNVEAPGTRISEQAERRFRALHDAG